MDPLQFIYNRKSVRAFTDAPVANTDIEKIIHAATFAPSGKNVQNWHFVVLKDKTKIQEIVKAVEQKNAALVPYLPEAKQQAFRGLVKYHTIFKGAPALVLVYAGPYPSVADDLAEAGKLDDAAIARQRLANPGIQNIAAAMENLLLAAAALGYGTCWMTGPTYAAEEISRIVGFSQPGYSLAALSPLGVPAEGTFKNPPRKPLSEVLTIIE